MSSRVLEVGCVWAGVEQASRTAQSMAFCSTGVLQLGGLATLPGRTQSQAGRTAAAAAVKARECCSMHILCVAAQLLMPRLCVGSKMPVRLGLPPFWLSCDTLPSSQGNLHTHGPTDGTQRLPNTLSVSIRGLQATQLLEDLASSLAASAGAACHSGRHASMSHVLEAMQVCRRAWAPEVAE